MLGLFRRRAAGNDVALVTANFGGIDDVKPLPPHPGIDAFYYTDAATAGAGADALRTWSRVVVPDHPPHDCDPRLRSRYFKHQIHRLDEVRGHRWLVWADASLRLHDLGFVMQQAAALARLPRRKRVLLVPHPDRRNITEEYDYIRTEIAAGNTYLGPRYGAAKMAEQMAWFRTQGWDLRAPLYCGTFWMVENADPIHRAWDAWWDQNLRFGLMDQLSLPVVLDAHGFEPQTLDVPLWDNPFFTYVVHPDRAAPGASPSV